MTRATIKQDKPIGGDEVLILSLVLRDLKDRAYIGKIKYGEFLKPNNGRCALTDAYQEALDLCMYLRQELYEKYKE